MWGLLATIIVINKKIGVGMGTECVGMS